LFCIFIVHPFAPLKPLKITIPSVTEYIVVPSVAAISIPE